MDEEANSLASALGPRNQDDVRLVIGAYHMRIIIEPPTEAHPGNILYPPPTICLRAHEDCQEGEDLAEDLSSFWAFVSVVSDDGMVALAPPSTTLISGSLVDSVHKVDPLEDEDEIGYFLFPSLRINQPGSFRLRISLLHMPTVGSDALNADGSVSRSPGAINTGSVVTRMIRVHDNAPVAQLGRLRNGLLEEHHLQRKDSQRIIHEIPHKRERTVAQEDTDVMKFFDEDP
ncbi:MAG: hypothetical protein Q9170_003732 [Blastenia crenularia]